MKVKSYIVIQKIESKFKNTKKYKTTECRDMFSFRTKPIAKRRLKGVIAGVREAYGNDKDFTIEETRAGIRFTFQSRWRESFYLIERVTVDKLILL